MSDDAKITAPKPDGVHIPTPALIALLLAFGGVVAAYVFVSKVEFLNHARAESNRITVVEETSKHHNEALHDLKSSVQAIDQNVRTLMIQQGVPDQMIVAPKEE
jgi:hypothetical protein